VLQAIDVTDQELLAAVRQGDERAFATLHERYRTQVYGIALRILGQPEDAEDICQEVFLRLHQQPPLVLDGPRALSLWLARVTTNAARNLLRSRRRAHLHWLRWLRLDWPSSQRPAEDFARAETTVLVRAVLDQLSERDRALLALRISGFSYEEIAATLGIRPSSVGTLLARAERRFRERYEALSQRSEEVDE